MADWNTPLPVEAVEGAETHVEDHNRIRANLDEVRGNVDEVEDIARAAPDWEDVTGKPSSFAPSEHQHEVADVDGLQAALDGKQASGDYATSSAVADLTARIDALEAAAAPEA